MKKLLILEEIFSGGDLWGHIGEHKINVSLFSCRGRISSGSTRSEQTGSDLAPSASAPSLTTRGRRPSLTGLHKPTSSASLPDTGTETSTSVSTTWFPHVKKRAAKASSSASSLDTSTELPTQDQTSSNQRRLRLRKPLTTEQESTSSNSKSKRSEQRPQESSGSARASAHARLKKRFSGFQLKTNEEPAAEQSDLSEPPGLRQSLRKKKATGSCASNKWANNAYLIYTVVISMVVTHDCMRRLSGPTYSQSRKLCYKWSDSVDRRSVRPQNIVNANSIPLFQIIIFKWLIIKKLKLTSD
jgi:hypothetical protein